MKKTAILAVVAFASLSFATPQSLKTEANKMNAEVAHAFLRKDMDAFEKITRAHTTSDFKYVEAEKTYTFDEMVSQMKQSFATMKKITACSAKSSHFVITGDAATSQTDHYMAAIVDGPDKKQHKMVMNGLSKDTYRKENGMWKLAEMDWTNDKMTLDGKPYDMSQAPSTGH